MISSLFARVYARLAVVATPVVALTSLVPRDIPDFAPRVFQSIAAKQLFGAPPACLPHCFLCASFPFSPPVLVTLPRRVGSDRVVLHRDVSYEVRDTVLARDSTD